MRVWLLRRPRESIAGYLRCSIRRFAVPVLTCWTIKSRRVYDENILTYGLLGILTTLGGVISCAGESTSPVCSIELDLHDRDREEIASIFDVIAKDLGLHSRSYHNKFPSGTDITILELDGEPVASLVETSKSGIFDLALYPIVREGIHEEVVSAVEKHFGLSLSVPSDCL
jgi:hypothetical protein